MGMLSNTAGGNSGGGDNRGVFPDIKTDFNDENHQFNENHHTNTLEKYMQYSESERLDILYDFLLNNSEDNTYNLESDRKLTESFIEETGLKTDRGTIKKHINLLIDKGWISELIELNKQYKLLKDDLE
jgi:hypothetical protein